MSGFGRGPVPGAANQYGGGFGPRSARLRLLDGAGTACAEWGLDELRTLIGRADGPHEAPAIDLRSYDTAQPPAVSRRHAELYWQDGRLLLVELGSTNGTWLNGERLATPGPRQPGPPVELTAGDRLCFGLLVCEIVQA